MPCLTCSTIFLSSLITTKDVIELIETEMSDSQFPFFYAPTIADTNDLMTYAQLQLEQVKKDFPYLSVDTLVFTGG